VTRDPPPSGREYGRFRGRRMIAKEGIRLAHIHLTNARCLTFYATATGAPLNRDRDPVVIPGDELPSLLGSPVHKIVAFSCHEGWDPILVQIEERLVGVPALASADVTRYTSPADDVDLVNCAEFTRKFASQ
jgi:hypothetical protein